MARVRLSRRAEADLLGIGTYTLRAWGEDQAGRYIDDLEAFCETLAANPAQGRRWDEVRRGLRRMETGQHVVFYREETGGILVSRVLHQRMLPEQYDLEEEDGVS